MFTQNCKNRSNSLIAPTRGRSVAPNRSSATLKAAADFFYPPVTGKVICADGKERDIGEEKYLNRLQEFLVKRLNNSTSKDLLKAELEAFGKFLERLNNLASKGVHASVALAEAKQGLVGLYFFLFNLSQNLSRDMDSN